MGRTRRIDREPVRPKPVEKIELSENNTRLRLAGVIALVLIAAGAIAYGVYSYFNADPGWKEIGCVSSEVHCGNDFILMYHVGEEGSARAEERAVGAVYSQAAGEAYRLFSSYEEFEDVYNLCYLNRHPNEEVEVDPALYKALSVIVESGDRSVYLGPVYELYGQIFYCEDDTQAAQFDPYRDEETAQGCREWAAYAGDSSMLDIELLDGGRVRLFAAPEVLAQAEEDSVTVFLDLAWMENAFRGDYIADKLAESGFIRGCLSSIDGFVRDLDRGGNQFSLTVSDREGETVYPAATASYTGPVAMACLIDRPRTKDSRWFYTYRDGTVALPYVDEFSGKYAAGRDDLICYSREGGCAEVLLAMRRLYVSGEEENGGFAEGLSRLKAKGIFAVWCEEDGVYYNDPAFTFAQVYRGKANLIP